MAQQKLGGTMRYVDIGPAAALRVQTVGGTLVRSGSVRSRLVSLEAWEEVASGTGRRADIARAVLQEGGSVAAAAVSLGVSRARVYQALGRVPD